MDNHASANISSSPYETAAVSMTLNDPGLIRWLITAQHRDGSWGGKIPFAADRLLQSMMVVRALLDDQARNEQQEELTDAIVGGSEYIINRLASWRDEELNIADLCGFELLVPAHHSALERAGLMLPPLPETLLARQRRKLALLPPDAYYDPRLSNLHHSLEALDGNLHNYDLGRLEDLLFADGSLASSPSATAFLLRQPQVSEAACKRMRAYLDAARNPDGGYSPTYPLDQVVLLWQLYFERMVTSSSLLHARLLWMLARLKPGKGVGANALFVADGDDTAVAALLATEFGLEYQALDLAATLMRDFFDAGSGHFRTYRAELTASPTTSAHAVEALVMLLKHGLGSAAERAHWQAALVGVADYLVEHLWVADKWHVSKYYSILRLTHSISELVSLHGQVPGLEALNQNWVHLRRELRVRLLAEQDVSGGWGDCGQPTVEETAYATLTLLRLRIHDQAWFAALRRSRDFLSTSGGRGMAEMWIDKTLYQAEGIISSAVHAALGLLGKELGNTPRVRRSGLPRAAVSPCLKAGALAALKIGNSVTLQEQNHG